MPISYRHTKTRWPTRVKCWCKVDIWHVVSALVAAFSLVFGILQMIRKSDADRIKDVVEIRLRLVALEERVTMFRELVDHVDDKLDKIVKEILK